MVELENIGKEIQRECPSSAEIIAIDIEYIPFNCARNPGEREKSWRRIWTFSEKNKKTLEEFLENDLNKWYDADYGTQEVYGNVWFKDGSWLERRERDGGEWWHHCYVPKLPELKDSYESQTIEDWAFDGLERRERDGGEWWNHCYSKKFPKSKDS